MRAPTPEFQRCIRIGEQLEQGLEALKDIQWEIRENEVRYPSIVELLAPTAHEKDIELAWAVDSALPRWCWGDEVRVRQIVTNLLGNAIKSPTEARC